MKAKAVSWLRSRVLPEHLIQVASALWCWPIRVSIDSVVDRWYRICISGAERGASHDELQPACAILIYETKRLRIDEEYRFIEWHWLAKQKPT